MGESEERVRKAIKAKYGSIPKMAEATGIPQNTIYHALERGLDNTRTETSKRIMDAVRIEYAYVTLPDSGEEQTGMELSHEESELLSLFRDMDGGRRALVLDMARELAK